MNENTLGAIVGTDGLNPLQDTSNLWKMWSINEIYLGREAKGKYIPKVGDMVVEIVGFKITRYIVVGINWTNGVAELRQEESNSYSNTFSDTDTLLGLGGSTGLSSYICYIDKSTSPYRLSVDQRLYVMGSMTTRCKIFRGNLLTSDGEVISRSFGTNGLLNNDWLDLEIAGVIQVSDKPVVENKTIRSIRPGYTVTNLDSGELVTAVFYSDEGFVVHKQQLVIEETSFIQPPEASTNYVTGISVISPFIQNEQDRIIRFPLNVPLAGLNLIGVVHYLDGSTKEFPVDGRKFKIMGFSGFVATRPGVRIPLTISYQLAENEKNYAAVVGSGRHIAQSYEAITVDIDGSYGVRLFCVPSWIDYARGYELKWYLYNLNRNLSVDVTELVRINATVSAFDPIAYGRLQTLSVSLNLNSVSAKFKPYVYTQAIELTILRQGTERLTNWKISYTPGQPIAYGDGIYAGANMLATDRWSVNLRSDASSLEDWLQRTYYASQPLINPQAESLAPKPTHFAVIAGAVELRYPIENWDRNFVINRAIPMSSSLVVKFIRVLESGAELDLACCGFPVYEVDSDGAIIV